MYLCVNSYSRDLMIYLAATIFVYYFWF